VFDAVHRGDADPKLLAYQYLQTLPKIAQSPSSKMWFLPSELSGALGAFAKGFAGGGGDESDPFGASRPAGSSPLQDDLPPTTLTDPAEALAEAKRESAAATADATSAGNLSGRPFDAGAELGQRPGPGAAPLRPADPAPLLQKPEDTPPE